MSGGYAVSLTVNGARRDIRVDAGDTLLTVLRDELDLTGAKRGCNQGVCGACTVLMDGQPVRGCLSLAVNCAGRDIVTVEGLAKDGELSPMQQAFVDTGAVQCGFCTPGMLLSAEALLAGNPRPSVDEIRAGLAGNLCRCSGYVKVIDAVLRAAQGGSG